MTPCRLRAVGGLFSWQASDLAAFHEPHLGLHPRVEGVGSRPMSAKKELKEIVKSAEKQGWRVKRTKKGHLMFLAPDGVNKLTTGGTPGEYKAIDNLLAHLRRHGFKWKGR